MSYFEDFEIGAVYEHSPGRTITQADNICFSLLTMNQHPLHCDEEYGKQSEVGRCIVSSPFTLAVLVGMTVPDVRERALPNRCWRDIKLTAPVFPGDPPRRPTEVLEKRDSKSRPEAGIV